MATGIAETVAIAALLVTAIVEIIKLIVKIVDLIAQLRARHAT
jgi:hypothetical protein